MINSKKDFIVDVVSSINKYVIANTNNNSNSQFNKFH